MKLLNDYKVIYSAYRNSELHAYATKNLPAEEDVKLSYINDEGHELTAEEVKAIKLVYSKNNALYYSLTGLPTEEDHKLEIYCNGELVFGDEEVEPEPDPEPTPDPEPEKNFTIVDATNFNEARHTILEDYYNCWPVEAEQDGEEWPAWNPAAFPWLVINHNFDGETRVVIKLDGEVWKDYVPEAKAGEEPHIVDRTWAIWGIPEIAGPQYAYKTNNPGPNADWEEPDEVFDANRITVEISKVEPEPEEKDRVYWYESSTTLDNIDENFHFNELEGDEEDVTLYFGGNKNVYYIVAVPANKPFSAAYQPALPETNVLNAQFVASNVEYNGKAYKFYITESKHSTIDEDHEEYRFVF